MVKLFISSDYFGYNESEADIRKQLKMMGALDLSFDENGSAVVVMSENKFEDFIAFVKKKTMCFIDEIIKKYDNIKSINYDNFFSNYEVIGKGFNEKNMRSIAIEIFIAASTFQVFDGIPQLKTNVTVTFKNKANSKSIKTIDTRICK